LKGGKWKISNYKQTKTNETKTVPSLE
jgi:hypothetical protein